jgi:hypothetical protein
MTKTLIPQIKIRRFLPIAKEILRLVLLVKIYVSAPTKG